MKIELIRNEEKEVVGWHIIAENKEERLILGSMRHVQFWGTDDSKIAYDGIETEKATEGEYVTKIMYATEGHKRKRSEEFRKQLLEKEKE
jgi:hypothetical protein